LYSIPASLCIKTKSGRTPGEPDCAACQRITLVAWCRGAGCYCIRYEQDKQHEDDKEHNCPTCISAKCAAIVHERFPSFYRPSIFMWELVARTCPITRDKQEEQYEDDKKHDRPTCISAECSVHGMAPPLISGVVKRTKIAAMLYRCSPGLAKSTQACHSENLIRSNTSARTRTCYSTAITGYEQEEQHENNQEHNCPTCVSAECSIHFLIHPLLHVMMQDMWFLKETVATLARRQRHNLWVGQETLASSPIHLPANSIPVWYDSRADVLDCGSVRSYRSIWPYRSIGWCHSGSPKSAWTKLPHRPPGHSVFLCCN
jgi:hypothetical protein